MAGATRAATSEMEPPATKAVPGRSTLYAVSKLPSLQAFGVAFPGSGSPSESKGACPISQKVFVALEERGLPYVATYLDEMAERPKWIQKQFESLNEWLKSRDKNNNAGKVYESALREVDDYLKKNGPYLAGDNPTDIDFDFAPKVRHARTLLLHFMDFLIPNELVSLLNYINLMENRPSFKRTESPDNDIIFMWQKKLSLPERVPLMQSS